MKLNVKLFSKLIDLLLSDKVPNAYFRFDELDDRGCGCALFHARKNHLIKDSMFFIDEEFRIPEKDYNFLFGESSYERELSHDTDLPTKEEVAQVMEDYLTAVEMGMVPGVEV